MLWLLYNSGFEVEINLNFRVTVFHCYSNSRTETRKFTEISYFLTIFSQLFSGSPSNQSRSLQRSERRKLNAVRKSVRKLYRCARVASNQRPNFLQLHLRDAALKFFPTLPAVTRSGFALSLTAPRNQLSFNDLREVHALRLENEKFHRKSTTIESFPVNLQTNAQRAYPFPEIAVKMVFRKMNSMR